MGDSTIRATNDTGIAATGAILFFYEYYLEAKINCCNNQTKTKR